MGIKICPQCGGKVSDIRNDCPHCQYDFTALKKCPDCEEQIDVSSSECPVCGHVFGVETTIQDATVPQIVDDSQENEQPVRDVGTLTCPYCNSIQSMQIGNDLHMCAACKNKFLDKRGLPITHVAAKESTSISTTDTITEEAVDSNAELSASDQFTPTVGDKTTVTDNNPIVANNTQGDNIPILKDNNQCRKTATIWMWSSIGFTILAYLVTAIFSLIFTGSLHWMFIYLQDGYIAGFICMGVGIIGYVTSLCFLWKSKGINALKITSIILILAILCITFVPLIWYDPFLWTKNGDGTYNIADVDYSGAVGITIPPTHKGVPVTSVGDGAFSCATCESIDIPDSVTSIGNEAFSYCKSLTSITIPSSVTSIGDDAFLGCFSLTSIKYRGTEEEWKSITKESSWNYDTDSYTITYNYTGE